MYVHLVISHPSVCLTVCLPFAYLFACGFLSMCLSVCLSVYMYVHPIISHLSVCLSVSVHPSVRLLPYPFITPHSHITTHLFLVSFQLIIRLIQTTSCPSKSVIRDCAVRSYTTNMLTDHKLFELTFPHFHCCSVFDIFMLST